MAFDPVKNFAIVEVSTGYDDSATSIVLATGEAAKLPDPATDGAFNLVWFDAKNYGSPSEDPNREIIRVTGITDDTLTVTRAQESTTASTKNTAGGEYKMINAPTEKILNDLYNRTIGSLSGVTEGAINENDMYLGNATGSMVATAAENIPVGIFQNDGTYSKSHGDGSDGDVTISSGTTTLTRDMFYNNLTVDGTGVLKTAGYRVFVKGKLTVDASSGASINNDGGAGGDGEDGDHSAVAKSGGTAGTGAPSGYFKGGVDGGAGGDGNTVNNGNGGSAGNGIDSGEYALNDNAGADGGNGGSLGGTSGGPAGTGGAVTSSASTKPRAMSFLEMLEIELTADDASFVRQSSSPSAGGGGGGAGEQFDARGGGGGGGGGSAGILVIYAGSLDITGAGAISANGGDGGDGGAQLFGGPYACGGGGGGGGNGGVAVVVYGSKTGTGTITASGGAMGVPKSGESQGSQNGQAGVDGLAIEIVG